MSRTAIYIIIAVIVFALLGAVAFGGRSEDGINVFTTEVKKRSIQQKVSASGKIFPQAEVKISSDVSGEIVELTVEEGDSVKAGQFLARIDPDAFESQVARGQANVDAAKANQASARAQVAQLEAAKEQIRAQLINAREIYNRNKDLSTEGVISQADLEASKASLDALEANFTAAEANIESAQQQEQASRFNVRSSQATLDELRTSLRRTNIYAPTDGVISNMSVEEGERVVGTIQMAGTELMRIADLNAMEVRVEVSENDVTDISLGDEVEIEVDAYRDRTFKGRISQIASSSTLLAANSSASSVLNSDQVTNFEVRITIDPSSYEDLVTPDKPFVFRPGMSAGVDILTNRKEDILTLPIASVTTRENEEEDNADEDLRVVVYAVEADSTREIVVETGIQDSEFIEVESGIREGQTVVKGPYTALSRELKTGSRVNVKEEDTFYENN
ncbi:MAG: efflux RND transporter periplasmic adaptor subunit [Bacteroidota bacterium]